MKEGCINIQLICPSFGDVRVFMDLPYMHSNVCHSLLFHFYELIEMFYLYLFNISFSKVF